MSSFKSKVASLLTGASLTALSMAAMRGSAAAASQVFTGSIDHINISTDLSAFINEGTIGPGEANPLTSPASVALFVEPGVSVGVITNTAHAAITAYAKGGGIGIVAETATALLINGTVPVVNNAGLIEAFAGAHATGVSPAAVASAYGVAFDGFGSNAVNNTGNINAVANATAVFGLGIAAAHAGAEAVQQSVTGAGTASVSASVVNSGPAPLLARAAAQATGYGIAAASATAVAVNQVIQDAKIGTAFVSNLAGHTIAASAHANASAYGIAAAFAAATGVHQLIRSAAAGFATVNNAGNIFANASAHAFAFGIAAAEASATGVHQHIGGGTPVGLATVINTGNINAIANASAVAIGIAAASANAIGVHQNINAATAAKGLGQEGIAAVNNAGQITALAVAGAFAGGSAAAAAAEGGVSLGAVELGIIAGGRTALIIGGATAYGVPSVAAALAEATGVNQRVANVGSAVFSHPNTGIASANVVNSGLIQGVAKAFAEGVTTAHGFFTQPEIAVAFATAYGVKQRITDSVNGFLNVTNSGQILAVASAVATAAGVAVAGADAVGVKQSINGDGVGLQGAATVHNSATGLISAFAHAQASAYGVAQATATATGVHQRVHNEELATATVTNSTDARIVGSAQAVAIVPPLVIGTNAFASARAAGVNQAITDAFSALETVSNSGHITARANAFADTAVLATAYAAAAGVRQVGTDVTAFTALVTNDSTGVILASAYAAAGAFVEAQASARAAGVFQSANEFNGASLTVDNSGTIQGRATALAGAITEAFALARAVGVAQSANTGYGAAIGVVTNESTGSIVGLANAGAVADGFASAKATAIGVDQFADAIVGAATFTVNNAGNIGASAYAKATSYESRAFADAYAAGVLQEGVNMSDGALKATVTNAGDIGGLAHATALALGRATANAYGVGVSQYSFDVLSANFTVNNSGTIGGQATANALSLDSEAFARATANGIRQFGSEEGAITALVTNSSSGLIEALAKASAAAPFFASAYAAAFGVAQTGNDVESANFTVNNAGHIGASATAYASAYDHALADAFAEGVFQGARDFAALTAIVTNSAGAQIAAFAKATAYAAGLASAYASAYGVSQYSFEGATANLTVTNSGFIGAKATALAISTDYKASATAAAVGVLQQGLGIGSMVGVVNNSSAYANIAASAKAQAGGFTSAHAEAFAVGVGQLAEETDSASFTVNNSGNIQALATAYAAALGAATARATAYGVAQDGFIVGNMAATVTNNPGGSIFAGANAQALAGVEAFATANAVGVLQFVEEAGIANFTVKNGGSIGANASALASAGFAEAQARAVGISQYFDDVALPTANVSNSGSINVHAKAQAFGTTAFAFAKATGIHVSAFDDVPILTVNINNTGSIHAAASAVASGFAEATAIGIFAGNNFGVIQGTIANAGKIHASAFASGFTAVAHAVGIWDPSEINGTNIVNTGIINAYAQANGLLAAAAFATGILISGPFEECDSPNGKSCELVSGSPTPDPNGTTPTLQTVITNNGGTIWAGESTNGGPILRGNAINTAGVASLDIPAAPNPTLIQLEGITQPGHIFGDIIMQAHDTVVVQNGKTFFDGIINDPNYAANYNSPSTGYPFVGTVNVASSGDLVLCQEGWTKACDAGAAAWASAGPGGLGYNPANGVNGPAYIFANSFTNSGTLAYQLTPLSMPSNYTGVFTNPSFTTPSSFVPGNYSQVFANTANLGGTLQAWYLPGLYFNNTFYQNIVEAASLNGSFANVIDNSVLLNTQVVQQGGNGAPGSVSLDVTRVPFGSVPGLTQNEQAAGGGIEKVYQQLPLGTDPFTGTNKFDQLVATLFTIDNVPAYAAALDQLSGAQYAQMLQSVIWSTREINKTIAGRMECQIDGAPVGPNGGGADMAVKAPPQVLPIYAGCFTPGHWNVWAQGHYSWDHDNGDSNAPGYKENQYGAYLGADYAITTNWFIGIAGGYFNSNMDFDQFGGVNGGSIRYSGGQVAGYGGYDDRLWYGRAIVSAGFYSGNSTRFISITGSPVDPTGSPDADVVSFYGEAGYHWYVNPTTAVTPLVGLTVAHGWLNGFTENDDGTGAALNVSNSNGTSVASRLGVRFSTVWWGAWRPEAMIAWQHEFGDTAQTVNESFADAPAGANFSVLSSNTERDWAVAEAGVSYFFNPNNKFSLLYNGFFNQDYTSNSVVGRWTTKW
jgi:trimeric autotransporter adhesin